MSCIRAACDLGAAPALYLYSGKKETSRACSMLKTAAALVLLVPGVFLALGSLVLNILLSPCSSSKLKVNPKEITDASKDLSVEEPKPDDEISLFANLSGEDLARWGKACSALEEKVKTFRSRESLIIDFFFSQSKNLNHPKMKVWRKDPHKYISETPLNDKGSKSFGVTYEKYSQFPECLKHSLYALEESQGERTQAAKAISEDRKLFETLLITALSSCRHTCFQYLDLYDQKGLEKLDRFQRNYYASSAELWRKLRRLYRIEKNESMTALCDMRIQTSQTFSNFLHAKIKKRLLVLCK